MKENFSEEPANNLYFPLNFDIASLLIDHIKQISGLSALYFDKENKHRISSIFLAAKNGHHQIVKMLLENGARYLNDRHSIFYFASANGHLEVIQEIILFFAFNNNLFLLTFLINEKVAISYTPLWVAALNGHLEIVKLLLGLGATLEQDDDIPGILSVAAQEGHFEMVKFLLEQGEDINQRTKFRDTPFSLAEKGGHAQVYALLKLWKIKEANQTKPVNQQIIDILNTSTSLKTNFEKAKSFVFSDRKKQLSLLINQLKHYNSNDINALKKLINDHKSFIMPEKYDFIFCYVLKNQLLKKEINSENLNEKSFR